MDNFLLFFIKEPVAENDKPRWVRGITNSNLKLLYLGFLWKVVIESLHSSDISREIFWVNIHKWKQPQKETKLSFNNSYLLTFWL